MIKAIIFDWGGVLGPDNNKEASIILSEKYNISYESLYNKLNTLEKKYFKKRNNAEYYSIISKEFKIPADEIKHTLNNVPPGNVLDFAKEIKKTHVKLFILSNQMKPRTDAIKKNNDLSIFSDVFFSNELKMEKPNKEIFNFVMNKINLKPIEIIFIDNNKENIDAARLLEWNVILYESLEQLIKELQDFGVD